MNTNSSDQISGNYFKLKLCENLFNDSILAPQTEAPADESPNTQSQRMKFIRQRESDRLRKERQRQRISQDPEERNTYLYNHAQSQKRYRQR